MLQKMTTHKIVAVMGFALALILGSGFASDAQLVRSEFTVDSLFELSNPTPMVNERVEFEVNLGELIYLNLHKRTILLVEWDFGDGMETRRASLDNQLHTYTAAGEYEATLKIYTPTLIFTTTQDVRVEGDFQPVFEQIEFGAVTITTFDVDADNHLSDAEFFAVIDSWVEGKLNTDIFFLAVDIWVQDDTIIASRTINSSGILTTDVESTPFGYTFSAQGVSAQEISLQIMDVNGKTIFERQKSGQTLLWSGLDSSATPVANGTYFYLIKTIGADGEIHTSGPQPIAVMR